MTGFLSPAHFLEKLDPAPTGFLRVRDHSPRNQPTRRIDCYFFYGSFAQPTALAGAIGTHEAPKLRCAEIVGYRLKGIGYNKALHDGLTGEIVEGYAGIVGEEEERKLAALFELTGFESAPCHIVFKDGAEPAEVPGHTFR